MNQKHDIHYIYWFYGMLANSSVNQFHQASPPVGGQAYSPKQHMLLSCSALPDRWGTNNKGS